MLENVKSIKNCISIILFASVIIYGCAHYEHSLNTPADHKEKKHGIMHKTGMDNPVKNCTPCHGDDLKGGDVNKSCYSCHGKEW
jgi:hypothetical protein